MTIQKLRQFLVALWLAGAMTGGLFAVMPALTTAPSFLLK